MPTQSYPSASIAIIGLGCRYPDARNPRELWENVLTRRQSFRPVPDERLPLKEYGDQDKTALDKTYVRRAAVIDGFEFDWARMRIPKQVFEQTDITHWLALEVALQAIGDAGYESKDLPRDRTGVIIGNTLTGEQQRAHLLRGRWPFVRKTIRAAGAKKGLDAATLEVLVAETEHIYKSFFPAPNEDTLAGALANTIAGRVCNYMDLRGGGYTVDGACASSLLSVATAANALSAGDIDVALAGGVDVSLDAFELVGFARVGALSDSDMKVYDRAGNGFLPGEGCGFIVMKRLEDAHRDGDYVYAVLNGWGISSDGKGGITAPTVDGQSLALRRAYERAGYSAHDLDFVEGHGTGTSVGDPVELMAIANTIDSFGEAEPHRCGVTSFKSLVGHTKAAAGIGGLLKAVAGVNRRVIPPTAGCEEPHEVFTNKARNLYPVRTGACRGASSTLTAGVSAMGFGGINSHVTLTSGHAPSRDLAPQLDERALLASKQETELFVFGEESLEALEHRLTDLLDVVSRMSVGESTDLAASLARRVQPNAPVRAAVIAGAPEDLQKRFQILVGAISDAKDADDDVVFETPDRRTILTTGASRPRVGFLFPGQGSQRLNMARMLVERFDWARELVAKADQWLEQAGADPVSHMMFRDVERDVTGEHQKEWTRALTQTEVAQPAICLASLLWLRFLRNLGLEPATMGGHSLGELTAFCAANAMDQKSVIQLAGLRGKLMGEVAVEGSMASLACDPTRAQVLLDEIDGYVVIANINSANQTVVSGDSGAVAATVELANSHGIHARELPVSAAFHSAHFADTVNALRALPMLEKTASAEARLYSTMTGVALDGEIDLAEHFSQQVIRPVNFEAVARLATSECDVLVEVGPGAVLSGLSNQAAGVDGPVCLPVESKAGRDQDLNIAIGYLFARGAQLNLPGLWEQRLVRRFKSAAELSFFVNPCEKPLLDAALISEPSFYEREASERVTGVRPRAPVSQRPPTLAPGTASSLPHVSARSALLGALHQQTGFPVDMLTDELRMIDDLHMDSIKTVQVVVDVATALGYAGDFDPAEIANATLGEIVQELEARVAAASEGRSGSMSPTRAAEVAKSYPGWTRSFTMRWHDAPLPDATPDFWAERAVCILDDGSEIATDLWERIRASAAKVEALPMSAASDIDAEVIIAVLSDEAMGSDARDRFERVTELLASLARGLPISAKKDSPQTVVFLHHHSHPCDAFDWGYDGFVAALHLERKGVRFRALTVDEAMEGDRLCSAIAREIETDNVYDAARYFGEDRRVARPEKLPRKALAPRAKQLDAEDVVLVTGGARGITAECALALARQTGAQMVLVGSSPSPAEAPDSSRSEEIEKTLSRFADEGLRAEYLRCDLTRRQDVLALVEELRRRERHPSAVIHGAAVNHPRRSHTVSAEDAREEIGPKLVGALNLFDAFEDDPPAIFCALTSVIGVTGMPNNAWYAFANQALDLSLGTFADLHPSTEPISIAFSVWEEVGMGANLGSIEALAVFGTDSIPVDEGVRRFVDVFTRDSGERQVVVTGRLGGIDTWRPQFPALPKGTRFLEDVRFFQPGVELIVRSHLELERDPYLHDHCYKGSYLFPTVFGLEAMGQAVAHVLGRSELPGLSVEDLGLQKPLLVDSERGLTIEIKARVIQEAADETVVETAIRSEQTGFASDHFVARFVIDAPMSLEGEAEVLPQTGTNIEPARDLYGLILFQGPRFQRITGIRALSAKQCVFDAHESPESSFVLGDPYLRDGLLQSLQLCTVPDRCLPVRIKRIDIANPNRVGAGVRTCSAEILEQTEDAYVGSVVCRGEGGETLEKLAGYHAKIIEREPKWPTAEELSERGAFREVGASTEVGGWEGGAHYRDVAAYGPQQQMAFFLRFPLTAQDCQGPSGTVNFTNYYRWAGKTRELGTINTPGAYSQLIDMLASQNLTAATNSFETKILAAPRPNDMIEVRYWAENVTRLDADAVYEWWRIPFPPGSGSPEMIAWSKMKTSAVKVLDHGQVISAEWPEFFFQFLNSMGPRTDDPTPEPSVLFDMGDCLYSAGDVAVRRNVQEDIIETSFEDSNVVGNIYFANYGVWQGRARDRFMHQVAPSLFDRSSQKMIHCVATGTQHVREAMPFDRIAVHTFIDRLYERGIRLGFEFIRLGQGEPDSKLAYGFHEAICISGRPLGTPRPTTWPGEARELLIALAVGQSEERAAS